MFNNTEQVMDFQNFSFYNPNCYDELRKFADVCTDFKANVLSTFHNKFIVVLIVLSIIIAYTLIIKYAQPKFSKSDFYLKYIDRRIDFILAIVTMIMIAYIFF